VLVLVYHSFGRGAHHPNAVEAYASRQRHQCDPISEDRDELAGERELSTTCSPEIPRSASSDYHRAVTEGQWAAVAWTVIGYGFAYDVLLVVYLGRKLRRLDERIRAASDRASKLVDGVSVT
jgi:hypothetical protein